MSAWATGNSAARLRKLKEEEEAMKAALAAEKAATAHGKPKRHAASAALFASASAPKSHPPQQPTSTKEAKPKVEAKADAPPAQPATGSSSKAPTPPPPPQQTTAQSAASGTGSPSPPSATTTTATAASTPAIAAATTPSVPLVSFGPVSLPMEYAQLVSDEFIFIGQAPVEPEASAAMPPRPEMPQVAAAGAGPYGRPAGPLVGYARQVGGFAMVPPQPMYPPRQPPAPYYAPAAPRPAAVSGFGEIPRQYAMRHQQQQPQTALPGQLGYAPFEVQNGLNTFATPYTSAFTQRGQFGSANYHTRLQPYPPYYPPRDPQQQNVVYTAF